MNSKDKAIKVMKMSKKEAHKSMGSGFLPKESAEQQHLNRIGRAGTKAPKHGEWPQYKKVS